MAIKAVTRNPDWTRDELVLAAEFYKQHAPRIPSKTSSALDDLSNEILATAALQGLVGVETFRNSNGVYMKLMELRKYDPSYFGTGLGHGKSRDIELEVWNLPPDRLAVEASQIRSKIVKFIAAGGSPEDARGISVKSEVLKELLESNDPLEKMLAHVLLFWQEDKRKAGRLASLGYEPRDIRKYGAETVIAKRILDQSIGFEEVSSEHSYECIVIEFPDRFTDEVKAAAQRRIEERALLQPTIDQEELSRKVRAILSQPKIFSIRPKGQENPAIKIVSVAQYERDPRVVAYVLDRAKGICEACESPAPFSRSDGSPYLEVHHILPLAQDGPDTVENCAALCPNCHRAIHSADNKSELSAKLFERLI